MRVVLFTNAHLALQRPTRLEGAQHNSPQVAAYQCAQPLFGTALGVLVLGEQATWFDLGALGVVGGLLLVTRHAPGT